MEALIGSIFWIVIGTVIWMWLIREDNPSTDSRSERESTRPTLTDGGESDDQQRDGTSSNIEDVDTDLDSIRELQR